MNNISYLLYNNIGNMLRILDKVSLDIPLLNCFLLDFSRCTQEWQEKPKNYYIVYEN